MKNYNFSTDWKIVETYLLSLNDEENSKYLRWLLKECNLIFISLNNFYFLPLEDTIDITTDNKHIKEWTDKNIKKNNKFYSITNAFLEYKFWDWIFNIKKVFVPRLIEEIKFVREEYCEKYFNESFSQEIDDLVSKKIKDLSELNIIQYFQSIIKRIKSGSFTINQYVGAEQIFENHLILLLRDELDFVEELEIRIEWYSFFLDKFQTEFQNQEKSNNINSDIKEIFQTYLLEKKLSYQNVYDELKGKSSSEERNSSENSFGEANKKTPSSSTTVSQIVLKRFKRGALKDNCKIIAEENYFVKGVTLRKEQINIVCEGLKNKGFEVNLGSVTSTLKDKLGYKKTKKGY